MFGFLRRRNHVLSEEQIIESLMKQFSMTIVPQMLMLEAAGTYLVPTGRTASGHVTGYLLGLCEAIIRESGLNPANGTHLPKLARFAFTEIYGPVGTSLGIKSIELLKNYDIPSIEGHEQARIDMENVYSGTPMFTPMGFWNFVKTEDFAD